MSGSLSLDFQNKAIVIIDGHALIHRAFHALPPLTNKEGQPVGATYGFLKILFKIIREYGSGYIVVAFDSPGPTFRHKIYKEYKATRVKAPDELYQQVPRIKEALAVLGIKILEESGFEADDIIGTLVAKLNSEKLIVTGDNDLLQLADDQTKIILLQKGISQYRLIGPEEVKDKYQGLCPDQLVDLRGLKGDSSDNLPGVPGIGEKTGRDLLLRFGNMEEVYNNLDELPEKLKSKLEEYRDQAFLSREMALIFQQVEINNSLENYRQKSYNKEQVANFLKSIGLKGLIPNLP
jgi:DNA polymerase I